MKLTRRKFLEISSATFATAALSHNMIGSLKSETIQESGIRKVPTYCNICFWKCGAIAYVRDGKLWKIEGNPLDPLSRGRLCPRGSGGVGMHYDPDRLKAPLIRTGKRGEEKWAVATWDEAFNYIAEKMLKIKENYGPESIAFFSHGIGGNFLKHTLRAFGVINIVAPSFAQCRGPREIGFELTFGDYVGSPERTDIRNTKCLALIGSHLGENMHNTQVQDFAKAIENGASIIVVDPRFSIAAGKAKYYLPIKPGTDLALLLSWMNVLVGENLYDKDFVNKYGWGFEAFVNEISIYTPEWAYTQTGITPELIRATARELALHKPASLVHPGRHVNWYGDDTQRSRAIALVNALLGNWNRKGGFFKPAKMSLPKYPYPPYPESNREKADNPENKYPFVSEEEGLTNGIREATLNDKPYPIKAWFVYGTNLLESMPNQKETIDAINKLDLLVAIDVIPSEITGWADVVLPEAVYLERFDEISVNSFYEPFALIRQPVVNPPDDQKPGWWIAKKLAEKINLSEYFPWEDIEDYLKYRVETAGFSYDEFKSKGIIFGEKQPIYENEGVEQEFYTPSGKIEFYSNQLAEYGFDPVPRFNPPEEPPPGYFRLLFGRAPVHTFSQTQTNRILRDMMDENEVWINSDIAQRMGLKSGDYIRLQNQDGIISNKVKVKATQKIRGDCVYMVHGFGHRSKALSGAYMRGASDAELITKYNVDPIMGGTGMNVNFVTILMEA